MRIDSSNIYRIIATDSNKQYSEVSAITASRALASDVNGLPVASSTTAAELGYVNGVRSSIQVQIDSLSPANMIFLYYNFK